ncbi:MAG: SDR family oxidoreductase [Spirochaetes bacterium]|nr:SDR family oxidoreductase [Spirochaetota bacterium]
MEKQVAIITGAAGGIGRAITAQFVREKITCVLVDINKKALADMQKQYGDSVYAIDCDITDIKSVKSMIAKVIKKYGGIDILVNNAGIIEPNLFENTSYEEINRQIQVNCMGPIYCTFEALPYLKKSKRPAIVTIASLAGIVPETYSSIYTATKFALRGLFLTLHIELKKKIHVATVFPDSVNTPMLQYEATHGGSPLTFLSKPQKPEDVAKAVVKALHTKKPEIVVPASQGFVTRFIMVFPRLVVKLWPILEKMGTKNKENLKNLINS